MRILLDTNVVPDALLGRAPWSGDAESIRRAHAADRIEVCISASSLTDVFYVSRRIAGRDQAWRAVRTCLDQLVILAVGRAEAESAALLKGEDFEDNLQIACAVAVGLEFIVTRDPGGFADSPVPVLEPAAFLAKLPGV